MKGGGGKNIGAAVILPHQLAHTLVVGNRPPSHTLVFIPAPATAPEREQYGI